MMKKNSFSMKHLKLILYFVNQVPKHFQVRWNDENKPLNTALPLGNWNRTHKVLRAPHFPGLSHLY